MVEYYTAWKRQGLLTQATPWMKLAENMLNEKSQSQKDKKCVISFI